MANSEYLITYQHIFVNKNVIFLNFRSFTISGELSRLFSCGCPAPAENDIVHVDFQKLPSGKSQVIIDKIY